MKKYNIIYADPPWQYKVYSKKGLGRSAESHYQTMSLEDIQMLPVGGFGGGRLHFIYVDDNPTLAGLFFSYACLGICL